MSTNRKTNKGLMYEALVPEEEQPYEVPDNWVWTRIENTIEPMETREPKKLEGKVFHYIDVDAIDNKTQSVSQVKEIEIALAPSRAKRRVSKNDVIISLVRPYLKNIALINIWDDKLVASTAFYVCTPRKILSSNYLYSYLCSIYATQYLIKHTRGDNSPSVRSKDFEKMPLPVPPLYEQKRISEKIERLLGKIEEAKQLIEEVKESFELRRAAILEKAFLGELTRKWREGNGYFGSVLNWQTIKIGDLVKSAKLGLVKSVNEQSENYTYEYLKMNNISAHGDLDLSQIIKVNYDEDKIEGFQLTKGDFVFNTRNSYELVGKCSVVDFEPPQPLLFNNNILRIRFINEINPYYVKYYLNSPSGKKTLNDIKSATTNVAAIYAKGLYSVTIPVPPLEEQDEIVKILDTTLKIESKINSFISLNADTEMLKSTILAKAFRGELGTNDPSEVLEEEMK
ncbi:type I restriction enzyme, S subunit [Bacillus sp. OK838]|nr:type I restriction enzyme, S subunit [Bacillus sp. OK838]